MKHVIFITGAFSKGTHHFLHSGKPADSARAAGHHMGPYAGAPEQSLKGLAALEPEDADAGEVARVILGIVEMPLGSRPFRRHVDLSQDGAEIVNAMADRVRAQMPRRMGLEDLLRTHVNGALAHPVASQERDQ
jgi:hypothetical protein